MSTTTTMPRAFRTSSVDGPAIAGHQSWVNSAPTSFDTIDSSALLAMIATDTATTAPQANATARNGGGSGSSRSRATITAMNGTAYSPHATNARLVAPRSTPRAGNARKNTTAEPRKNSTTKSQKAARSGCQS